jgi:hypothetical protein
MLSTSSGQRLSAADQQTLLDVAEQSIHGIDLHNATILARPATKFYR